MVRDLRTVAVASREHSRSSTDGTTADSHAESAAGIGSSARQRPSSRDPAGPRVAHGARLQPTAGVRLARVREALAHADLAAVVCALPANVLLLSGYWPVVGPACAIVWRAGPTLLVVPPDERTAATRGWSDVIGVLPGSSGSSSGSRTLAGHLAAAARQWGGSRIGVEHGPACEPASYVGMCLYGPSLPDTVRAAWAEAEVVPADDMLADLRAAKTPGDVSRIAAACRVAARGFTAAARSLRPGRTERLIAARVRTQFSIGASRAAGRADGFAFCMSGRNSAEAYRAYARSTAKRIAAGELVLVHANSYVDGYWTDVTRTYCMGRPDDRQRELYEAVFEARRAALDTIRPGVSGQTVDEAARQVLVSHGYGAAFTHSTGHGVGFAAIDHNARPRLAPGSVDVLEPGMVCNVEPAIYLESYGGLRHCDVVEVTSTGAQVLTPFQATIEELTVT
jgi:Xaa-Pro aminopeptidase